MSDSPHNTAQRAHATATAEELAGTVLGDYRLEKLLGSGGMGSVYLSHAIADSDRETPLAVKVLDKREMADPEARERFIREIQAVLKIRHPHIVQVLEVGEADGFSFFVMEYVPGANLWDTIGTDGPLPERLAVRMFSELLAALAAMHDAGFVHRDVKPDNILIGPHGIPKLVDFGLVRELKARSVTVTGTVLGTPMYMAPEQFDSANVDGRADLYALGCVLYHAVTGQPPFAGEFAKLAYQHLQVEPIPPRELMPNLSARLEAVILKMLRKKPEWRFADAATARRALLGEIPVDDGTDSHGRHRIAPRHARGKSAPARPGSRAATAPPVAPRRPGSRVPTRPPHAVPETIVSAPARPTLGKGPTRARTRSTETAPAGLGRPALSVPPWLVAVAATAAILAGVLVMVALSPSTPESSPTANGDNESANSPAKNAALAPPATGSTREPFAQSFAAFAGRLKAAMRAESTPQTERESALAELRTLAGECPERALLDRVASAFESPLPDAAPIADFADMHDAVANWALATPIAALRARLADVQRQGDLKTALSVCEELPGIPLALRSLDFTAYRELKHDLEAQGKILGEFRGLIDTAMAAQTKDAANRAADKLEFFCKAHRDWRHLREHIVSRRHLYGVIYDGSPLVLDNLTMSQSLWLVNYDYVVRGILRIESPGTLEIMAGATFRVEPGAGIWVQGGEMFVHGRRDEPVVFTAAQTNLGWGGVLLKNSRGTIEFARFERGAGLLSPNWENPNSSEQLSCGGNLGCVESTVTCTDCEFSNGHVILRSAGGPIENVIAMGGGVYAYNGTATFTRCTFANNTADTIGGGLALHGGQATLTDCVFRNNRSMQTGGAIASVKGELTAIRCHFVENHAENFGGAFVAANPIGGELRDCKFERNSANRAGGAIRLSHGFVPATGCEFRGNRSADRNSATLSFVFGAGFDDRVREYAQKFQAQNTVAD